MQLIDWLALAVILLTALIGILLGFGKLLKAFTGGVVGIIISIVVTYFSIGVVASWPFVQDIMASLVAKMEATGSGFVHFFVVIGVEKIILAIILFFIIQLLRIIIVVVIKGIVEVDNPVMKAFNRIAGMIFMFAVLVMVTLLVFHVIDLIGGSAEESFKEYITGALRLDKLFENNPLQYIVKRAVGH